MYMIEIGKVNWLTVLRETDFGLILDGEDLGEILMPCRYIPAEWEIGDELEIFLMLDSEDRLTATNLRPVAMVGEFAYLRVAALTEIGAFLDWGLPKDLFVPFREQKVKMREGESYVVHIYYDDASGRIAASSKLDKFLDLRPPRYHIAQQVDLLICDKTDLGYKAIIDGRHWGVLFYNAVFQPLTRGQRINGYIRRVREDEKIDLCLSKPGDKDIDSVADSILTYLKEHGGFMLITDKSAPEDIGRLFGVSKKTYKRAIGGLYKKRLIDFEDNGTKLA